MKWLCFIGLVAVCVLIVFLRASWTEEEPSEIRNEEVQISPETPEIVETPTIIENTLPAEEPVQPTPEPEVVEEEPSPVVLRFTPEEAIIVAQTVYGEAGICSYAEKRLVVWCVCNRVDSGIWGDSVTDIITPSQFHGYNPEHPIVDECLNAAWEVLTEWSNDVEADVLEPYASTSGYLYFWGDGRHNWYREEY